MPWGLAPPQHPCPVVYSLIGRSWQERGSRAKPPQRESLAVVPTSSGQQPGYGAQSHRLNGAGSPKGSRGTIPMAEAWVGRTQAGPRLHSPSRSWHPALQAGCCGQGAAVLFPPRLAGRCGSPELLPLPSLKPAHC